MSFEELINALIDRQFEEAIGEVERAAAENRHNTFCIRTLADASKLLRRTDVSARAEKLLRNAPDAAFFAGMMSNVELPKSAPEGLRRTESLAKLEEQHPPYQEEKVLQQIRVSAKSGEHIALCLNDQADEARAVAQEGLPLEDVGQTCAFLGKFDIALTIARDSALTDSRQKGVLLVLVIELFRRAQFDAAKSVLTELEGRNPSAYDRIHLALGFGGKIPWCGYPFADW
jgi:hypothetical protein